MQREFDFYCSKIKKVSTSKMCSLLKYRKICLFLRGSRFPRLAAWASLSFNSVALQCAVQRARTFKMDARDVAIECSRRVDGIVVDKNAFGSMKPVFGKKRMVDAQIRLCDFYITGSNAAIE